MPVPTFDQLLRPVLQQAALTEITRQSATAKMIEVFKLTPEEQQESIASGATKLSNRTGWAMSHLIKAELIHKVAKFTYRATDKGVDYLSKHSDPITVDSLKQIEGWKEAWDAASKNKKSTQPIIGHKPSTETPNITPEESIDGAIDNLRENLRQELVDHLLQINP